MSVGVSALARVLLAIAALAAVAACAPVEIDAPPITASVLVEPSAERARWFRDVEVQNGTDGYELLEAVTDGNLEAKWFPEFRSHFVTGILGIVPGGDESWGVFVWSETNGSWEPLSVGADLFPVEDGHVMGWALVGYDPDTPQLPVSAP